MTLDPVALRAELSEAEHARDGYMAERDVLRKALVNIDALDPEHAYIGGVTENAAKGMVLRMGYIARADLSAWEAGQQK